MKKLFTLFASIAFTLALQAQYTTVDVQVYSQGMPAANQKVDVNVAYRTVNTVIVLATHTVSGFTDLSGRFIDSIPLPSFPVGIQEVEAVLQADVTDCNGVVHVGASGTIININNQFPVVSATVTLPCPVVNTPPFCNASYIIDTANSGLGTVYIWNTSTPLPSAAHLVYYSWDFGDGNTSNLPFPSHVYGNSGWYNVCLTVTAFDMSTGDTCVHTFCDSLGIDSLGNVLYKSLQGFQLQVLDPNSIGINEAKVAEVKLYPNPVSEVLVIEPVETKASEYNWTITDLKGAVLRSGTEVAAEAMRIDVSDIKAGIYILSLRGNDNSVSYHKLKVE